MAEAGTVIGKFPVVQLTILLADLTAVFNDRILTEQLV